MESAIDIFRQLPLFVLVLFRMGGIFLTAPIFVHAAIPVRIKVAMTFFLALVVFPTVQFMPVKLPDNLISFGFMAAQELGVGAVIGFFVSMLFLIFSLAGTIVGGQIGLEMAPFLSPDSETGGGLMGALYYLIGSMVFLSLNAHHWLIKTLAFSYKAVPAGWFHFTPKLADKMIESFAAFFGAGVKLAAPFIIIGVIVLVVVGIVLKVTQQTNLFVLELPMKALIGFSILIGSAPFIIYSMKYLIEPLKGEIVGLLRYMR